MFSTMHVKAETYFCGFLWFPEKLLSVLLSLGFFLIADVKLVLLELINIIIYRSNILLIIENVEKF